MGQHGTASPNVDARAPNVRTVPALLTTAELASELRLSRKTIYRYYRDGKITPEYTLPGGEHRWRLESVVEQLRALRKR
jgi:predicted site-specific integrase-resolvase